MTSPGCRLAVEVGQGGGVHGDLGGEVQLSPAHGLQREQGGHDLGDAGGVAPLVGLLFIEHLLGVHVDEKGGRGVHGDGGDAFVIDGPGEGRQQPGEQ